MLPFTHRLALLGLLFVAGSEAQNPDSSVTFRTDADLVLVPVRVRDHAGETMAGLCAQDFAILDNGTRQRISFFAKGEVPTSVGLVLDTSGSMQYTLGLAKDIAFSFLRATNPEEEFFLLTVSTEPNAVSEFTSNAGSLGRQIAASKPGGLTALIDTVHLALNLMRDARKPERALVIMTDGMDNYSRYTSKELMRKASEADVQVYPILIDNSLEGTATGSVLFRPKLIAKPWEHDGKHESSLALRALAEETGGVFYSARNEAQARQAVLGISQAIHTEYMVGYQPSHSGPAGTWHRILVRSNLRGVAVDSRKGYYSR